MRDIDIRLALRAEMCRRHTQSDTRIVEELGVCQGLARVDVAVLNGSVHGYEIKSERDTLMRLNAQAELYSQALEFVTIVASEKHLDEILIMPSVPSWWGIWAAKGNSVRFTEIRPAKSNPSLSSLALVQFLWREEGLEILAGRSANRGLKSKSRKLIWDRLVEVFTTEELSDLIREQLKKRPQDWLAGPLLA